MGQFHFLVNEQMNTMEKLLYLHSELERCQEIEQELLELQQMTKLENVRREIEDKKKELNDIHDIFEKQTEKLIQTYQTENGAVPSS